MEQEKYQLLRSLGVGATAEVFLAQNKKTDTFVAIKRFSPIVMGDPESLKRVQEEVSTLRSLRHPNIVALLGELMAPTYALELEFVEGSDLRQWLRNYDLPLIEAKLWLLAQVARGLGAAHEREIIHRDLKPENILISNQGEVKITDFGLAKSLNRVTITRLGLLVGSLGYMAPEVIDGKKPSYQGDIFSFGVIAYEALTGSLPFNADTPQGIIKAISNGTFKPLREQAPRLPDSVCKLIERCISVDPLKRPSEIWSVEAELMKALSQSGLVSFGQDLVSVLKRNEIFATALAKKHQHLFERIRDLQNEIRAEDTKEKSKELLFLANQMKSIFPDDPLSLEVLKWNSLRSQNSKSRRKWILISLVVLLSSTVVWFSFRNFDHTTAALGSATASDTKDDLVEATAADDTLSESVDKTLAPAAHLKTTATSNPNTKKAANPDSRAQSNLGAIRFEVDEDVQVFVDNVMVPTTKLSKYPVEAGLRNVKMVKQGFLPIENKLNVITGRTSVIKARSNP